MNPFLTKLSDRKYLLLAGILALGGLLRLLPVLNTDFPVNDGGMFFSMTEELVANGFALPALTEYNHSNLAFAYPPLGFYLTGLITVIFNIPLLEVYRFFPAAISTLTILAFYLLAKDVLKEEAYALLATLIFAIQPRSAVWFVYGGGVTRAPGLLFALLALWQLRRTYHSGKTSQILLSILFSSLLVVSHPEFTLYTVLTVALYLLFHPPARRQWIMIPVIGIGVLVLTSWWWGQVLVYHGFAPFKNAFLSNGAPTTLRILLLRVLFFPLPYNYEINLHLLKSLAVIGLIGIWIKKRDYFYLAWLMLLSIFSRGGLNFSMIPIALIITEGFVVFNQPSEQSHKPLWGKIKLPALSPQAGLIGFAAIIAVYGVVCNLALLNEHYYESLDAETRMMLTWVVRETDANDSFLLLPEFGQVKVNSRQNQVALRQWYENYLTEWFPAITRRRNISTVQGTEWAPDRGYMDAIARYYTFSTCETVEDIDQIVKEDFDILFVPSNEEYEALAADLTHTDSYHLIYQDQEIGALYRRVE